MGKGLANVSEGYWGKIQAECPSEIWGALPTQVVF